MQDADVDRKAMVYYQKYLNALIQKSRPFVYLRQAVTRSSYLETGKSCPVQFVPAEGAIRVKLDDGSEKSFLVSTFEKIQWGTVQAQSGDLKYINITIKGDRSPLILHSSTEIMEFWYDALRMLCNQSIETPSSLAKIEVFRKATRFAAQQRPTTVEIPPPPENYNFVAKFPED